MYIKRSGSDNDTHVFLDGIYSVCILYSATVVGMKEQSAAREAAQGLHSLMHGVWGVVHNRH